MTAHNASYFALLIFTALLAAGILAYAWQQRGMSGHIPFLMLCVLAIAWPLGTICEILAPTLSARILWDEALYTCFIPLPFTYLALVLQYLGLDRWLTRWRLAALLLIPVTTILFAWTNRYHGLVQHHPFLDTSGVLPVIGKSFGPIYWVNFAYSYLLFTVIVVLLLHAWHRAQPFYRGQPLILLVGLIIPLGGSLSYTMRLSPVPGVDLTPMLLSISGIMVAWGLFRYRLFDIVPVARERVIESMSDGMIVLDALQRVVDMNPAAERLLGIRVSRAAGRAASFILQVWPELLENACKQETASLEIARQLGQDESYYDLRISPV
ncbi:MAG TPA: histidine kinase N-terminal 7TM domain-containing protein, partial [Armatimonadota bacterium]